MLNRKDSFITHRAFCDALAEESARLTTVPPTNLNFKNEAMTSSQQTHHNLGIDNNADVMSQFGFNHGMGMGSEQQRASLSMWLNNQGNTNNNSNNNGFDVGALYSSSGLGDHMVTQMTTNQANSNAFGGSCNFGMAPSSSTTNAGLLLSSGKRSEPMSKTTSPMSATALLQKAAQMGSTRSSSANNNNNNNSNHSIFSGTLGVMSSSSNNSHQTTSNLNDNNNGNNPQNISSTSSVQAVLADNNFNLDQLFLQTSTKQSEQQVQLKLYPGGGHGSSSSEHSLTRDFLGMGGGGAGGGGPPPPFLPQELAKFAATGSPMGLTQFSTANH